MTRITYRSLLLCSFLPLALNACSSGNDPMPSVAAAPITPAPSGPTLVAGAELGGTGAPGGALAAFTTVSGFVMTPHAGLEVVRPATSLTVEASPVLNLTRSTTGFDMAISEGTVRYDTRPGSTTLGTTNQYNNCIEACSSPTATRVITTFNSGSTSSLTYSLYGVWTTSQANGISRTGVFATGLLTTPAQMPTTGNASYSGGAAGYVLTSTPANNVSFTGDASFNLNFGSRVMTGAVVNIATRNLATPTTTGMLGNIVFGSGSITDITDNTFRGGAQAIGATAAAVDLTGAIGQVNGAFYGPTGSEAAGTFSLTKAGASVIGSFAVKR